MVFGNHRPISLLSSTTQTFERVAYKQIFEFFTSNNLLFNSQYGFRENHSTELVAPEFVDRIKLKMDRKKIPYLIFLDLWKAFYTPNHDILLTKLRYYGIQGVSFNWFQSYSKLHEWYPHCETKKSLYIVCWWHNIYLSTLLIHPLWPEWYDLCINYEIYGIIKNIWPACRK